MKRITRLCTGVALLVTLTFVVGSGPTASTAQAVASGRTPCALRPGATTPTTSSTMPAGTSTTTMPPLRYAGHCTILSIGDSVGEDLGIGLGHEFSNQKNIQLISRGVVSTGLVHDSFYNWPTHLRDYLSRWHPDVVIMCVGANDHSALYANGRYLPFLTLGWQREYAARIRTILQITHSYGARMIWVGVPVSSTGGYRQSMKTMNQIYASVVATAPDAWYLDTWDFLAAPNGSVRVSAAVNGHMMQIRALDLIHYSPSGCDVFATYVIRHAATRFDVDIHPSFPAVLTN